MKFEEIWAHLSDSGWMSKLISERLSEHLVRASTPTEGDHPGRVVPLLELDRGRQVVLSREGVALMLERFKGTRLVRLSMYGGDEAWDSVEEVIFRPLTYAELDLLREAIASTLVGLSGGLVTAVTFNVSAVTVLGQSVLVVGNSPQLGTWNTSKGVGLSAVRYPIWSGTVLFSASRVVEYKYVKEDSSRNVFWESGANRWLTTALSGSMTLDDSWD